jgi:hypothetical protein
MNNNIIISNNEKRKKVPLYVFVPEELAGRLRRFIALKHQTVEKGLLSLEVEQALKNYLAVQSTQQQNTQSGRSPSQNQIIKVKKVMEDIQKYLTDNGLYAEIPQFILEKHLDEAIANLRGLDKRTIRTWKQHLELHGYIRKSGVHRYEILKS